MPAEGAAMQIHTGIRVNGEFYRKVERVGQPAKNVSGNRICGPAKKSAAQGNGIYHCPELRARTGERNGLSAGTEAGKAHLSVVNPGNIQGISGTRACRIQFSATKVNTIRKAVVAGKQIGRKDADGAIGPTRKIPVVVYRRRIIAISALPQSGVGFRERLLLSLTAGKKCTKQ